MRTLRTGPLVLLLVVALSTLGIGYAAWTDVIRIDGTVETGNVSVDYGTVFTNDDGVLDRAGIDDGDTGQCDRPPGATGSCDPLLGPDPAARSDFDLARCTASVDEPGVAVVFAERVYPGYTCAAFAEARNDGSVPVRLVSVLINGNTVEPGAAVDLDLDGDGVDDLRLDVTGAESCQQVEPAEMVTLRVGHEFLSPDLDADLGYQAEFQFQQWNEDCAAE